MTTRRRPDGSAPLQIKVPKASVYEERAIVGIEDMVLLSDDTDNGITENLHSRLKSSEIYTYIGSVLVVCNPYKWLKIYEMDTILKYPYRQQTDATPHIFYTAECAYRGMIQDEENQCIIVSGESGAGKTETSKQIQTYIAAVCGGDESVNKLKQIFLSSNPVLEAFGNAKTLRNNNSSRFGKYFELKFNRAGNPRGGVITNYLLEKSRIIKPNEGERGFHIFYQLLSTPEYQNTFYLDSPQAFNYLSCSRCYTVDGLNDVAEFQSTIAAMQSVGIQEAEVQSILGVVAAILHLGNVDFVSADGEGNQEGSAVSDHSYNSLSMFCRILQLDDNTVAYVLTNRELQTTRFGKVESSYTSMNPVQAADRRDSLARSLYERLFNMIVGRINAELDPDLAKYEEEVVSIGVLDIYGFEIFERNGFEQLCINYVNEKLQQIFIELTLRAEQDEYAREGIKWTPIPFFNNRIVCELLDGSNPGGIFRLLDDVCKTMHTTSSPIEMDQKMLQNAAGIYGSHPHYTSKGSAFIIKHYAGDVEYQSGKLGETNKDSLKVDLVNLMKTAGETLVSQLLYGSEDDASEGKSSVTSGTRIRTQCQALVDALMECQPHYVRCIKSNDAKKALFMDKTRVLHQVKYLGLSENIKVRRAGFAYRCEYHRFLDRYGILSKKTYPDWPGTDADGCKEIINEIKRVILPLATAGEVQFGKSLIFIRSPQSYFAITKLRESKVSELVIPIQRAWKKFTQKKDTNKLPAIMGEFYSRLGKARNRQSLFREYSGSYLESLGVKRCTEIKDAMFRIIDFYSKTERVKFVDHQAFQIVRNSGQAPVKEPRLIALTDSAIYILEILDKTGQYRYHRQKPIPIVILRRRISFSPSADSARGVLQHCQLTKFADGLVLLAMKPTTKIDDPKNVPHPEWPDKDKIKACQKTGKAFGAFEWKKRCKATGAVLCNAACDLRQSVPDYGYYEPDRVGDDSFGLMSLDQIEDVLIMSWKKTEFIGLLLSEYETHHRNRSIVKEDTVTTLNLRKGPEQGVSRVPALKVTIQTDKKLGDTDVKLLMSDISTGVNMTIQVTEGIPEHVVEARKLRQRERARQAEVRRKQVDEERRVRNQYRDAEREQNRLARNQEKKAANATRKAETKASFKISGGAKAPSGGTVPSFGGGAKPMISSPASFASSQKPTPSVAPRAHYPPPVNSSSESTPSSPPVKPSFGANKPVPIPPAVGGIFARPPAPSQTPVGNNMPPSRPLPAPPRAGPPPPPPRPPASAPKPQEPQAASDDDWATPEPPVPRSFAPPRPSMGASAGRGPPPPKPTSVGNGGPRFPPPPRPVPVPVASSANDDDEGSAWDEPVVRKPVAVNPPARGPPPRPMGAAPPPPRPPLRQSPPRPGPPPRPSTAAGSYSSLAPQAMPPPRVPPPRPGSSFGAPQSRPPSGPPSGPPPRPSGPPPRPGVPPPRPPGFASKPAPKPPVDDDDDNDW